MGKWEAFETDVDLSLSSEKILRNHMIAQKATNSLFVNRLDQIFSHLNRLTAMGDRTTALIDGLILFFREDDFLILKNGVFIYHSMPTTPPSLAHMLEEGFELFSASVEGVQLFTRKKKVGE